MLRKKSDSQVHKALQRLCRNYGWSYGVFWRFDPTNSLLLTMEDAYYEEHVGVIIDDMLLQVHVLGNGIVGQSAFTNTHRWMFSDAVVSIDNHDMIQDNSEIHHQFSCGIETVVLISVEPRGVVQFGSTQKIPERMEFVDQTKRLFREIENGDMVFLPDNIRSSSNSEIYGMSGGLFASLISSGNSNPRNLKPIDDANSKNYVGTTSSSADLPWLSPFTSDHGRTHSSHLQNQLQMVTTEAPLVQSTTYCSAAPTPCISTWSSGQSTLTSFEQQLLSETRLPSSQNVSPFNNLANSVQSSVTNKFNSGGNKKLFNDFSVENDLFDGFGVDFECGQAEDFLNEILMPVVSAGHLDFITDTSERVSEQCVGSMVGPQERLFSKLGLEQFSSSNSMASSSFGDELSSTSKRKMGSCSVSDNQVHLTSLPCFSGNMNSLCPVYNLEPKKAVNPKSLVGSRIGDSYSITGGSSLVVSKPKKSKESAKVGRKRARPGSRPKPKDRIQIEERIAELRKLIPNGVKMSIDSLLAQTIKHMLFLQSVTKHAEKLQQADERKETELAQTMVDPVDVKDLSPSGQKLIQMLCEENGFFLEIIDIIQGFGLTILKGVMEIRENKIWACFIVEAEANRHVMKQEIYMSLHKLLYQKATSVINVLNGGTTLFNNYHQHLLPFATSHRLG
ncbi:transcription factor bHLH157-like [Camellia sinensis]|uniref:transcription factor bHLH157-like n=1 Tax=Camellia sinensis TaxID=4442 RepID=UPI0010358788|nr:transcription factor bHLH157-like [Camellia sinensis]